MQKIIKIIKIAILLIHTTNKEEMTMQRIAVNTLTPIKETLK